MELETAQQQTVSRAFSLLQKHRRSLTMESTRGLEAGRFMTLRSRPSYGMDDLREALLPRNMMGSQISYRAREKREERDHSEFHFSLRFLLAPARGGTSGDEDVRDGPLKPRAPVRLLAARLALLCPVAPRARFLRKHAWRTPYRCCLQCPAPRNTRPPRRTQHGAVALTLN